MVASRSRFDPQYAELETALQDLDRLVSHGRDLTEAQQTELRRRWHSSLNATFWSLVHAYGANALSPKQQQRHFALLNALATALPTFTRVGVTPP